MGLSAASFHRFRARVDEVLDDWFPATLIIDAVQVQGSGPGGRAVSQYMDGGEAETFRFPFRIPKKDAPENWTPRQGLSVDWKIDASTTLALEIHEVSIRPHEDRFSFVAKKRRVP